MDSLLVQKTWTNGVSGGGALNIAAVDLFANGATSVYYDNISLLPPDVTCDAPDDISWLSLNPTSGTTGSSSSDPVTVTFDSTGLVTGNYTGTLCINSNDPVTPLVEVPVSLTVLPNMPPVANDDAYNVTEDTTLTIAASGVLTNDTDVEGDPLTAVLDIDVTNGLLSLNSDGAFSYIPDADFCGTDSFTYHANDGQDDSNTATVTITVACENDAPVALGR